MNRLSQLWAALRAKLNQRWALILIIAGSFATITGCIASIIGIITFFSQPDAKKSDPAFYGRWISDYEYPNGEAMVKLNGVTEYLENDTYRYAGYMTVRFPQEGGKVVYRIDGSGEWDGNRERVLIKLNGRTDSVDTLEVGKLQLRGAEVTQLIGKPQKITDSMPQGMPERFEVLSMEPNKITMQVSDLQGNPITFDMVRTHKRIP